jgi:predicted transport protein
MDISSFDPTLISQIKNLEEKTGVKLDEWLKIINSSGLEKHGQVVGMLKEKYAMGHGYANMLVHVAKQSFAGAESNTDNLIEEQYKGKEQLREWYETLVKQVKALGDDVDLSPKKAYVSLRRKKQFGLIQPSTKTRLDIGLNMKGVEPTGRLEAAGSWNAMCTHRIKIEDASALNQELFSWIEQAYLQAG